MIRKQPARIRVTIREVAEASGVSTATVSRVLSGQDPIVRPELAERVRAVARRLHYEPNPAARSLRARKSNLVGVLMGSEPSPLDSKIVAGIDAFLQRHGHALVLTHGRGEAGQEQVQVDRLIALGTVGLIAIAANPMRSGAPGFPIVTVQGERAPPFGDNVGIDAVHGAQLAVRHLFKLGHRRIGIVAGPAGVSSCSQRLRGCLAAMKNEGIALPQQPIEHGALHHEGGYQAAARLLQQGISARPTALIVLQQSMVLGVLRLLHEHHIGVPKDLALVAFGDLPYMAELPSPLTAIALPDFAMGEAAAQLLLQRSQNPERPPTELILQGRLMVRSSCGAESHGSEPSAGSIYHSAVVLPGTKITSE